MDTEEFLFGDEEDFENGAVEAAKALEDEANGDAEPVASELLEETDTADLPNQVDDETHEVALEDLEVIANSPPDADLDAFELAPEVQDDLNIEVDEVDEVDPVETGAPVVDLVNEQSPLIEEPPSRVQSEGPVSENEEIVITETVESKDLDVEVENDELLTCPVLFHLKNQPPIALLGENSILSEAPDYLLTLDRVFGLLRRRIEPQEGQEIVFQITDLDLVINEDNIYAGETRISDLIEVLDVVPNQPDHLDITVSFQPRFVFGLNSLFEKLHAPPAKKVKR